MTRRRYAKPPRVRVQRNTRTETMDPRPTRSATEREALADALDELLEDVEAALDENTA